MSLLKSALKSMIPLLAVHTDDSVNAPAILSHILTRLSKEKVTLERWIPDAGKLKNGVNTFDNQTRLYYSEADYDGMDWARIYQQLHNRKSQLVVINPPEHPVFFNTGRLQVPENMLLDTVSRFASDEAGEDELYELTAALRGLTLKEMNEVSQLAMIEHAEFTPKALLAIRRQRIILSHGLRLIDTEQLYYHPNETLHAWLKRDGLLFRANVPGVIRPRGLLFDGQPGTGKTSGAKYAAHELGVPLYRLELAGIMQKYVGESEKSLNAALDQLVALAPCVLLLDEVEKIFSVAGDDQGVSNKVLSILLWWLQEHRSSVLTLMTTNRGDAIPKELIRPGRIDQTIVFEALHPGAQRDFMVGLLHELQRAMQEYPLPIEKLIDKIKLNGDAVTQAALTYRVLNVVKTLVRKHLQE